MSKPLAIDLFCGLGGWTEGLLAEGYQVFGFDIERHVYGEHRYPAQLVVQDVLTLHGSQFKTADLIVASPPCQGYSYMAMPWSRAKAIAADYRSGKRNVADLTRLFDACFRIQREACEAAGHHIPMVIENVRGAQPWVGRARWSFGSFFLWGDVPALMPVIAKREVLKTGVTHRSDGSTNFHGVKKTGGSWFNIAHNTTSGKGQNPDGRKTNGAPHIRDGEAHTRHLTNPDEHAGIKHHGSGEVWFDTGPAALSSNSPKRKMASAMIAKIPLPLSRHIAATYYPKEFS